jgi:hypothetical protein
MVVGVVAGAGDPGQRAGIVDGERIAPAVQGLADLGAQQLVGSECDARRGGGDGVGAQVVGVWSV